MSEVIAVEIVGIFALMFGGIVAVVMWFTHATEKEEQKRKIAEKKIEVYDKHFTEMVRIECPYCGTLYSSGIAKCPRCGAETGKMRFPKMPE